MNLGQIKTIVLDYANRNNDTEYQGRLTTIVQLLAAAIEDDANSLIGSLANKGEFELGTDINFAAMEKSISGNIKSTINTGPEIITLPTDLKQIETVWLHTGGMYHELRKKNINQLITEHPYVASEGWGHLEWGESWGSPVATKGQPRFYAPVENHSKLTLRPYPDSEDKYYYTLYYWAYLTPLGSSDSSTNWITDRYPRVLIYGSLLNSSEIVASQPLQAAFWREEFTRAVKSMLKVELHKKTEHEYPQLQDAGGYII